MKRPNDDTDGDEDETCYQPLWDHGETAREVYRRELEGHIAIIILKKWLIIGGDHNSLMGIAEAEETRRPYGMRQIDETETDVLKWCQE